MKNAPVIISVIALLGVILLFIDKFSGKNDKKTANENEIVSNNIAYVNMDTLMGAYNYYNDLQTSFYKKQSEKEAELDSRYRALQRKFYDISNQVKNQMMTNTKAQNLQQQLALEEQKIMQDKQKYELELVEEGQRINLAMLDSIRNYIKIYNEDKNYNLIFANDTLGGNILLAKKGMNITKEITVKLNERYNAATKKETQEPENKENK